MNSIVKNTCKAGQGSACCRYLVVGPQGFECAKQQSYAHELDRKVEANIFTAKGNNCDGYSLEESLKVLNDEKE